MCGFVGVLSKNIDVNNTQVILDSMLNRIIQRGPDDCGVWFDKSVALGHRRLSIHDLSALGKQPMHTASGRYVIVFNGEIYNYKELRRELVYDNVKFDTDTDTEVLLASVERWGLEAALKKFIGMFSFALWDKKYKKLAIARDRMGEKPLYYGWQGQHFLFGSQLSALSEHPSFQRDIDRDAVGLYLRYGYIPTPYSVYKNIHKLPSGTYLELNCSGSDFRMGEIKQYWSFDNIITNSQGATKYSSPELAVDELHNLLSESVSIQSQADVPLGAFLSGGIDSSTIVALMQSHSTQPINTFTIGFHEKKYNEAVYAKDIAKHLGTNHTELYINEKNLLDIVPEMPVIYDEPFADSSQIPTTIVASLAKKNVTVALSGDGGDELFCGYSRYFQTVNRWNKLEGFPKVGRKFCRKINRYLPLSLSTAGPSLAGRLLGREALRLLDYIGSPNFLSLYKRSVSSFSQPSNYVIGASEKSSAYDNSINGLSNYEHMRYCDTNQYLVDDILVKIDRAFMASSLEGRIPLLDHRIVEFAWQVPMQVHCYDGRGKYLLRSLLKKYVPDSLMNRPKSGFGVPLDKWLRGPLLEWADSMLCKDKIKQDGIFDVDFVVRIWKQHRNRQADWSSVLWSILMFNAWLETQ